MRKIIFGMVSILLAGCTWTFPPRQPDPIRFAVIGDYGSANKNEAAVATLVQSWNPDFILTVGDNNYPSGAASTIDGAIGAYYHNYIYPYTGQYGPGAADTNRFFPTLGNHDWYTTGAQPYLDYFMLPGNERYYSFVWGPVEFFAIDSDDNEPDGISASSIQAEWLRNQLAASTTPWQIVYFHVPPYSSGHHGSAPIMDWPFAEWGADAVLAGHDHSYERLVADNIPYIVNGSGGKSLYAFNDPLPNSLHRYNVKYGAMLIEASRTGLEFSFYRVDGTLIDSCTIGYPEGLQSCLTG
jgi:hypothetical protein